MLYGTLTEFCTRSTCPTMSAGRRYTFQWPGADGHSFCLVSAPEYIDLLMGWVQSLLDDENVFPQKAGAPFPSTFMKTVRMIFRRLFRVYAHIYYTHFREIVVLGEELHLNTSFQHFIYFVQEFNLVDPRDLSLLQPLIDQLCSSS